MGRRDTAKLTRAERAELSELRMINSALQLIAEHGIVGLRLTDVGLRAGYSRGLAAMRFGSKANLLGRIAQHILAHWQRKLRRTIGNKTGVDAVIAAIDTQCEWMLKDPVEVRTLYLIIFESFDPSARYHFDDSRMLAAQRRDMIHWIQQGIEARTIQAGIDLESEATLILAAMHGIIYQSFIDSRFDIQHMHDKLKDDVRLRLTI